MTKISIDTETKQNHWRGEVVAIVRAEHGIVDSKGRALGGKALVIRFRPAGQTVDTFGVLSYALRDGLEFGATPTRWSTCESTPEAAIAAGTRSMQAQGQRYARTFSR